MRPPAPQIRWPAMAAQRSSTRVRSRRPRRAWAQSHSRPSPAPPISGRGAAPCHAGRAAAYRSGRGGLTRRRNEVIAQIMLGHWPGQRPPRSAPGWRGPPSNGSALALAAVPKPAVLGARAVLAALGSRRRCPGGRRDPPARTGPRHPSPAAARRSHRRPLPPGRRDGRPVDQHVLDGKWSAVFFGYTNCPDTCPATLQALNAAGQQLGAARKDFQVVFISVDPARDTPAEMKALRHKPGLSREGACGPDGHAGRGRLRRRRIPRVLRQGRYGPRLRRPAQCAAIYLMDPQGRFVKPLDEAQPRWRTRETDQGQAMGA